MANPASKVASAKDSTQYVKDGTARGGHVRSGAVRAGGGPSGPHATSTRGYRSGDHEAVDEPGSAGSEIRRGIGGDPVDVHYGAERVVKRKIGGDTTTPSAATPRAGTPENPPSSTALREDGDHYIRDGTTTAARDQVERDSNKKRPTDLP